MLCFPAEWYLVIGKAGKRKGGRDAIGGQNFFDQRRRVGVGGGVRATVCGRRGARGVQFQRGQGVPAHPVPFVRSPLCSVPAGTWVVVSVGQRPPANVIFKLCRPEVA